MSAHVLPPLAVNSKSERKDNSLPPLGFEPVVFGMLAHLPDHAAKPHLLMSRLKPPYQGVLPKGDGNILKIGLITPYGWRRHGGYGDTLQAL
jgi:hypothetical protein